MTPRSRRGRLVAAGIIACSIGSPALAHSPAAAAAYHWVEPPSAGSSMPRAAGRTAAVTPELLAPGRASVWTPDAQAIVTIRTEAIDSPIRVSISPLAPSTLPDLDRLFPNGNAYEVIIAAAGPAPAAVELALVTPWPVAVVHRLDGNQWKDVPAAVGADGRVTVRAEGGGIFLAGAASIDGHDSWWASFSHDPRRPGLAAAGLSLAALGFARRARRRPREPA